jgi:hypothetical protein
MTFPFPAPCGFGFGSFLFNIEGRGLDKQLSLAEDTKAFNDQKNALC